MINVTYKGLKKLQACSYGLDRFKRSHYCRCVFNLPVNVVDITKNKHSAKGDFEWLIVKIIKSVHMPSQLEAINQVFIDIMNQHQHVWTESDRKRFDFTKDGSFRHEMTLYRLERVTSIAAESKFGENYWLDSQFSLLPVHQFKLNLVKQILVSIDSVIDLDLF